MSNYRCLDGSPIIRDGEYQTRDGRKAVVLGFADPLHTIQAIVGYAKGDINNEIVLLNWFKGGFYLPCGQQSRADLMRPWPTPIEGWLPVYGKLFGESRSCSLEMSKTRNPRALAHIHLSHDPATNVTKILEVVKGNVS